MALVLIEYRWTFLVIASAAIVMGFYVNYIRARTV